jgi:hypothetical protein
LPGGQSEGIRAPRGRVELVGADVVVVATRGTVDVGGGAGVEVGDGSTAGAGDAAGADTGACATDESDAGAGVAGRATCAAGTDAGGVAGGAAANWSAMRGPATVDTGDWFEAVAAAGAVSELTGGGSVAGVEVVVDVWSTMYSSTNSIALPPPRPGAALAKRPPPTAAMVRQATPSVVMAVIEYVTASRRSTQPPFRHHFVIHVVSPFGKPGPGRRSVIDSFWARAETSSHQEFGAVWSVIVTLVPAIVGAVSVVGVVSPVRAVVVIRGLVGRRGTSSRRRRRIGRRRRFRYRRFGCEVGR